jgi:protease-4
MKRVVHNLVLALAVVAVPTPAVDAQLEALKRLATGGVEESKQIAYFRVKGELMETPTNLPPLFGSDPPMSLKSLLDGLKKARQDSNVVAIVIDLQEAALGPAQLEEVHQALRNFRAVDKEVFVHADILTTMTYAASTGASHVSIVPTGDLWLIGLYGETPYLRGTLDKIGCIPDFEQCGDFKTAAEPLMRTGPSEQSKEMINWLLDGIYHRLVKVIAESRGMSVEKVRSLIDNGPYTAEEALKAGLVDSVKHRQDFIADLQKRYGDGVEVVKDYGEEEGFEIPDDNIFAFFEFLMKMLNPQPKVYTTPSVAIVYVEGPIMVGSAERSPFGGSEGAYSTTIRKALDKAAEDDSVKAVVLRVDSPGGSALASEIILDATKRIAEKKPLIVSMGNVAGSGGYYVTCGAETIFADPMTITASIGVIGGKLVTTEMWGKLGVNWSSVQRGAMAGILSSAQKFTDAERKKFRHYMETVYEIFKGHVIKARKDRLTKKIDDIAGGRVYTGAQALELGLVDKLGGLEEAIKFAAQRASLGDYDVRVIPEPPNIFDLLTGHREEEEQALDLRAGGFLFLEMDPVRTMLHAVRSIDPDRAKAMIRALTRVELIHREGVITMMPEEFLIR